MHLQQQIESNIKQKCQQSREDCAGGREKEEGGERVKTTLNRHFLLCGVYFQPQPQWQPQTDPIRSPTDTENKTEQNIPRTALVADTNALPLQLADTFHLQLLCLLLLLLLQLPGFTFRHVRNAVCHSAGQANVNKRAACLAREVCERDCLSLCV